jgi:hypothetical protein
VYKALVKTIWWAREELNLRPLPSQQTAGNRCARSRSPRSPPTVDAEGKRSLGAQLNALFRHLPPTLRNHYIPRLTAAMHRQVGRARASGDRWQSYNPKTAVLARRRSAPAPRSPLSVIPALLAALVILYAIRHAQRGRPSGDTSVRTVGATTQGRRHPDEAVHLLALPAHAQPEPIPHLRPPGVPRLLLIRHQDH